MSEKYLIINAAELIKISSIFRKYILKSYLKLTKTHIEITSTETIYFKSYVPVLFSHNWYKDEELILDVNILYHNLKPIKNKRKVVKRNSIQSLCVYISNGYIWFENIIYSE